MRVLKLIVQNFLGVKAVEINPSGDVVRIEGRNGQGKSSVIQAIWAAIGGAAERPGRPIRNGEEKAKIFVDLGDLTVTRSYTEKTETLSVRNKEGWEPKRQQDVLDALFTRVSLDPQEFIDMKPKERRELLLQITGQKEKLNALQAEKDRAFAERTGINRDVRNLEGKLVGAPLDEEIPEIGEEEKSMSELMGRLTKAQEVDRGVNDLHRQKAMKLEDIDNMEAYITSMEEKIAILLREIENQRSTIAGKKEEIEKARYLVADLNLLIETAPPSQVEEIQAEIDTADEFNGAIRKRKAEREERLRAIAAANDLRAELAAKRDESNALTAKIEETEKARMEILQSSAIPVPNLSIEGDNLLIGGIPFDDLSTSEQIKASMQIGISQNPKLRVLRISRGRELDSQSMAEVEKFAAEHDCQVWIECVSDEPNGGIFIENGEVVPQEA